MSRGAKQAKRMLFYSSILDLTITGFIILIGLLVFASAPNICKEEVWPYIVKHVPPFFTGIVCIGLLSMAMSTAASELNTCAILISYDMRESITTIVSNMQSVSVAAFTSSIRFTRLFSALLGLLAMGLAFSTFDLLFLLYKVLDFYVPIGTAPFILAYFKVLRLFFYCFRGDGNGNTIYMGLELLDLSCRRNQWKLHLHASECPNYAYSSLSIAVY